MKKEKSALINQIISIALICSILTIIVIYIVDSVDESFNLDNVLAIFVLLFNPLALTEIIAVICTLTFSKLNKKKACLFVGIAQFVLTIAFFFIPDNYFVLVNQLFYGYGTGVGIALNIFLFLSIALILAMVGINIALGIKEFRGRKHRGTKESDAEVK